MDHVGAFDLLEDQMCAFQLTSIGRRQATRRTEWTRWSGPRLELMLIVVPGTVALVMPIIIPAPPRYFPGSDIYTGGGDEARCAADPRKSGFTIRRNF